MKCKIENLKREKETISWEQNSQVFSLRESNAIQALIDDKSRQIFVLAKYPEDKTPSELKIFGPNGELIDKLTPPDGFSFSYLTNHPDVGVAVVSGSDKKIDGWYDWHFGYNEKTKTLFRHCPAY